MSPKVVVTTMVGRRVRDSLTLPGDPTHKSPPYVIVNQGVCYSSVYRARRIGRPAHIGTPAIWYVKLMRGKFDTL